MVGLLWFIDTIRSTISIFMDWPLGHYRIRFYSSILRLRFSGDFKALQVDCSNFALFCSAKLCRFGRKTYSQSHKYCAKVSRFCTWFYHRWMIQLMNPDLFETHWDWHLLPCLNVATALLGSESFTDTVVSLKRLF